MEEVKSIPKTIKIISWLMYGLSLFLIFFAIFPYLSELIIYLWFVYNSVKYYGLNGLGIFSTLGLVKSFFLIVLGIVFFYAGKNISFGKSWARWLISALSILGMIYLIFFRNISLYSEKIVIPTMIITLPILLFVLIYIIFSKEAKEFFK